MSSTNPQPEPGESPMVRARPHPVVYLRAALWLLAAAVSLALALVAAKPALWALTALLFLAGAACAAAEATVRRATTELTVTDRRAILRTGLLKRRVAEVFPVSLAGFEIAQGPLGRMLDYGLVRIHGLDASARLAMPEPERIRRSLETLAMGAAAETEPERAPAAPARLSVVESPPVQFPGKPNGDARPVSGGVFHGASLKPKAELDRF